MISNIEIIESPRAYPPSSSDLNVVLFPVKGQELPISTNLNVIYEKSQIPLMDGLLYDTELQSIVKFLRALKNLQFKENQQDWTLESLIEALNKSEYNIV
jgi:hypothetical protein